MAYMSINYQIDEHATGYPSNLNAQPYGEHILNIEVATDTDNGMLISADNTKAWKSFDVFEEKAVTTFTGIIEQQMPNGNWLVLVTNPGDAMLVYQEPRTPYESPREFLDEKHFYNKAGDVVRCYVLNKWDRFEVSALAFNGTPEAGKAITGVSNKKMTVSA